MPLKLAAEFLVVFVCAVVALRAQRLRVKTFAVRRVPTCILAALAVLILRAALLPWWPVPKPSIYDEFSYLLQADTFAHERLTNPAHSLWQFFEAPYILQQPTYQSKYPPGQGIAMAIGQVLTGSAWAGVWLSCGLMAAALCWALQGWVSAGWALVGTLIAFDLCVFTSWMNSYWGGAVAAIGGALVIGAYGRMRRGARGIRLTALLGLGFVILLLTRPYEGFLLAAPVAFASVRRNGIRALLPAAGIVAAGFLWTGYYDYRVTGHALRMPYQEYFAQYESVPPLIVMPTQPTKSFRHFDMEWLDTGWTRDTNAIARSWQLPAQRAKDLYQSLADIFGDPVWLAIFLLSAPLWIRARSTRLLAVLMGVLLAGAAIELVFYPHYAAPFAAVFLVLLVQSLRYLRVWLRRTLGNANLILAGLIVAVVGAGFASRMVHVYRGDTPDRRQAANATRDLLERNLIEQHPGKHVVFVRYTGTQKPHEEWIYNLADIDAQQVIWAQDMGAENSKLMACYPGRSFWLFQPDVGPNMMEPYK